MSKISVKLLGSVQELAAVQYSLGNEKLSRHYLSWYCAFRYQYLRSEATQLENKLRVIYDLQKTCADDMHNHIAYSKIDL